MKITEHDRREVLRLEKMLSLESLDVFERGCFLSTHEVFPLTVGIDFDKHRGGIKKDV